MSSSLTIVGGVAVELAVLYIFAGGRIQAMTEKMSARQVARTAFYCESSGRNYKIHYDIILWRVENVTCE